MNLDDGRGFTVIYDQHWAIITARERVLPMAEGRLCARHVYCCWAKHHRGDDLKMLFWNCARSNFHEEFLTNMEALRVRSERGYQDLLRIEGNLWCRAFYNTTSFCNSIDNNTCELFNAWILDARCKPIITILQAIEKKCLERFRDKYLSLDNWVGDISPSATDKLQTNKVAARLCYVIWAGGDSFKINDGTYTHVCNFRSYTCT